MKKLIILIFIALDMKNFIEKTRFTNYFINFIAYSIFLFNYLSNFYSYNYQSNLNSMKSNHNISFNIQIFNNCNIFFLFLLFNFMNLSYYDNLYNYIPIHISNYAKNTHNIISHICFNLYLYFDFLQLQINSYFISFCFLYYF